MLETDEVDADFFTPSSSTSLANIFKKNAPCAEDEKDSASLKYIPQLPPIDLTKSEDSRPTQCIFACALQAYEWLNNSYVLRGKLGFAIIKNKKIGTNSIVLYDSKKATVSNATITSNFEINVKKNASISYYDNLKKYWSVYASEAELHKILEVLETIGVIPRYSTDTETQHEKSSPRKSGESSTTDKENETSNTDSAVNRKTKKSILKRMANMGQSVLPNSVVVSKSASESSDSNQNYDQRRPNKHKHLKTISNRNNLDKTIIKNYSDYSEDDKIVQQKIVPESNDYDNNQQIVAFTTSTALKDIRSDVKNMATINDVSLLITEQRVSNSELRINLSKATDKLDLVLDKLNDEKKAEKNTSVSEFQNVLVQKLLTEYETKIKKYEEFINQKGFNCNTLLDDKFIHSDELLQEKNLEIAHLENKLGIITKENETIAEKENKYLHEISQLKNEVALKSDQIINLNKKLDNTLADFQKSDDAKNKIKNIMNDTFQSISAYFDDTENYSGAKVKNTVALVIKKTTMEAISGM